MAEFMRIALAFIAGFWLAIWSYKDETAGLLVGIAALALTAILAAAVIFRGLVAVLR